jgi:hypothetical protein
MDNRNESPRPLVFLSYARKDVETARRLHHDLEQRDVALWFDQTDLGPGKWKAQIFRAIRRSRYFIICLSSAALRQTGDEPGFQDTELTEAYNIAVDQDEAHFTIVPIRLEDCARGDHRLSQFQQFDLFGDWEGALDRLAVFLGGHARKAEAPGEHTESHNALQSIEGRMAVFHYAGDAERAKPDVGALLRILGNQKESEKVRCAAASALRWADSELAQVVECLMSAIGDKDPMLKSVAAQSLISLRLKGQNDLLPPLIRALEISGDGQVRFSAAAAIGKIGCGTDATVQTLVRALKDRSWNVRRISAEALAILGPQATSAVPALIEALSDLSNHEWVRHNAVLALASIAPAAPPVVAALSSASGDDNEKVRRVARESLNRLKAAT